MRVDGVGISLARFCGSATTVCKTLLTLEWLPAPNVLAAHVFAYQPHTLLLFASYFPVFLLLALRVSVHQKWTVVESCWNVMAHGDVREGKWKGNWWMGWVASTFHTTSEHGVSSINTADAHTSAASSRLNWRPRRFKWTRPFRWKRKSGFCACAITFQTQSNKAACFPLECTLFRKRKSISTFLMFSPLRSFDLECDRMFVFTHLSLIGL